MLPLAPDILMPSFQQYYPSVESLDDEQRNFYEYWKKSFENEDPRTADTSYIFIYVYEQFNRYKEGIDKNATLSRIFKLLELYTDQVGIHVTGWLIDLYLVEGRYEEAYNLLSRSNAGYGSDNVTLNIKLKSGRDIDGNDVINIAKRYGFVPTTAFKNNLPEVLDWLNQRIKGESGEVGILTKLANLPVISKANEYLMSGFGSSDSSTVELVDFFSYSELPTKSFEWAQEISLIIQEKYGRKRIAKKPSKQSRNSRQSLWELRIKDAFENPSPINTGVCFHTYLKLDNHWMVYRKYTCTDCKEVFMCECDKDQALAIRPYQTSGSWLKGICPGCRGLDDVSMVTDGKLMYGSTFYAAHWREIAKEADRLAIENKDELDYSLAENNIRLKYGVPLIGEGWVSETLLFKNLQQLLPQYKVIHHGRPEWLGRMHLDVYIPEINYAFEYQGKQHHSPVEYFGGKESFEQTQKRDIEKARLCKENGVKLIYINEGDDFSKEALLKILKS